MYNLTIEDYTFLSYFVEQTGMNIKARFALSFLNINVSLIDH